MGCAESREKTPLKVTSTAPGKRDLTFVLNDGKKLSGQWFECATCGSDFQLCPYRG